MWQMIIESALKHLPIETLGRFFRRIVLQRKLVALLVVAFAASSVWLLAIYYRRSGDYSDIVNATLHAKLEPTAESFKGLEAFILSKFDPELRGRIEAAQIDGGFVEEYDRLVTAVSDGPAPGTKDASSILRFPSNQAPSNALSDIILTDRSDATTPGFLFLPLHLIRKGHVLQSKTPPDTTEFLKKANELLDRDVDLRSDVLMTRRAAKSLENLLSKQFVTEAGDPYPVDNLPAQVYLITGTGLNRIFSSTLPRPADAERCYGTQFSPNTFFPSRPYFQGALSRQNKLKPLGALEAGKDNKPTALPVSEYFYVSNPYPDLGGNGVLITVSRVLRSYRDTTTVLCLDFRFKGGTSLSTVLNATIDQFHADKVKVRLEMNTKTHLLVGDPQVLDADGKPTTREQQSLIDHAKVFIQSQSPDPAAFFGNIQKIGSSAAVADKASLPTTPPPTAAKNPKAAEEKETDEPLEVSIPIGNIKAGPNTQSGDFLLFRLDLDAYRHRTDLIGFSGYTCLGVLSVLLVSGLIAVVEKHDDLSEAHKNLRSAFAEVGAVLWDAPTPYTLLGGDDKIRDCNRAFCDLLKRDSTVLMTMKFRDLVTENDKTKYDLISSKRLKSELVEPYLLSFETGTGETVSRWIASAAVPSLNEGATNKLPETFGVLLTSKPASRKVTPIDTARSATG
jgi:PAS domain-containing protein